MVAEGTERELVRACQRGERDAFHALFEHYRNKVYSIALRFSGDESAAMDIAQDTFVKMFSSIRDFRGDSSFETWVYRMVVNSCLDHKRKFWRLIPMGDDVASSLRSPCRARQREPGHRPDRAGVGRRGRRRAPHCTGWRVREVR